MTPVRTYFIRTRNRNRILATLVCRIVRSGPVDQPGVPMLAFGLARASKDESSPARKIGRLIATQRLEESLKQGKSLFCLSYQRARGAEDESLLIGGTIAVSKIVPVLTRLLLDGSILDIPEWAFRQDSEGPFNQDHQDQYVDMFCKIRNSVEKGTF
jgi:hypothetical protein